MAKGDQKKRVMQLRELDEPGYYAFARLTAEKRHFNTRLAAVLKCYVPDPLRLLIDVPAIPPADIREEEVLTWLCQDCPCPLTLLHCWMAHDGAEDLTTWGWLARELAPTPTRLLERFGDRNQLTPLHRRSWCDENGTPLDVQVMDLSITAGREITEQDAVEFIYAHPRGPGTYDPVTPAKALSEAFYQRTGFRLTRPFAERLLKLIRRANAAPIPDDCPF